MKTKAENKHKSLWRNIKIVNKGRIIVFELDDQGKMKTKLPRQHARDLTKEIHKIPSEHYYKSQPFTTNTLPAINTNMIMPFSCSYAYTQGTNLINYMYQPPPISNSNPTLLCNQTYATRSANIDTNLNSNSESEVEKYEQSDATISDDYFEETFNEIDLDCRSDDDDIFFQHFFDFNDLDL